MRYVGVRAVPHGWLRDRVELLYVMDDIRHYFNLFYTYIIIDTFHLIYRRFAVCWIVLYSRLIVFFIKFYSYSITVTMLVCVFVRLRKS